MLRSYEYAAWAALFALAEHEADTTTKMGSLVFEWRQCVQETFIASYFEAIEGCPSFPSDRAEANRLLDLFILEKALYEIGYEAANRPGWIRIPIAGLRTVLDSLTPAGKVRHDES
jgi:maltose alpha-D-glucosyltransferase/alpha-amylase